MKNTSHQSDFPRSRCKASLLVLVGTALLALPKPSNAQFNVYHPFPDSNAVWGMESICIDPGCADWAYIQNYTAGDTVINGQTYIRIDEHYLSMTNNFCCPPPGDAGPGYLREDTVSRQVYWLNMQTGEENLLFDFSLDVGDTLEGYLYECTLVIRTVVSVDSVLIGQNYRRRINFDTTQDCTHFSIIEGIGSTCGLTGCFIAPFAQSGTTLSCFTLGGELLYTAPGFPADLVPCGELPSGVPGLSHGELPLRATPNPSTGLFHLGEAAERITVYTAMGRRLFRTQGNSIDLSAWPPGVYTAVLQTARGTGVQRLVVVR
jgi:hypothetical protein